MVHIYTYVLLFCPIPQSGFTDTVPIPVRVSVGDAASPLPLDPATPSSSLHPKLLRYSSGEQLAATNQDQYEVCQSFVTPLSHI